MSVESVKVSFLEMYYVGFSGYGDEDSELVKVSGFFLVVSGVSG